MIYTHTTLALLWKDQLHLEGLGTGTMPIPSEFMIMKWKWNCRWVYRGGFCSPVCRTRAKHCDREANYYTEDQGLAI